MDTAELKRRLDAGEALEFQMPSEDPELRGIVLLSRHVPSGIVASDVRDRTRVRRKFLRARREARALYCVSLVEDPTPAAVARNPADDDRYRLLALDGFARVDDAVQYLRQFGFELSELFEWKELLRDPVVWERVTGQRTRFE